MRKGLKKKSDWNRVKSNHHPGMHIVAKVIRIEYFGVICSLPNAKYATGVIKNKDLDWDVRKQKPNDYSYQQQIEVEVIGFDEQHWEVLLSRKRAVIANEEIFKPGCVLTSEVMQKHRWGYEVYLKSGVFGKLELSETPDESKLPPETHLQVGDKINVEILGFDENTKQPNVSLLRTIEAQQIKDKAAIKNKQSLHIRKDQPVVLVEESHAPKKILVADDGENIRTSLRDLLSDYGHSVVLAASTAEIATRIEQLEELDIAVLDFQYEDQLLCETNIVEKLRCKFPDAKIYLYTGNLDVMDDDGREKLTGHLSGIISKGMEIATVYHTLMGDLPATSLEEINVKLHKKSANSSGDKSVGSRTVKAQLNESLHLLARHWQSCKVLLLHYEDEANQVEVDGLHSLSRDELSIHVKNLHNTDLESVIMDRLSPVLFEQGDYLDPPLRFFLKKAAARYVFALPVNIAGHHPYTLIFLHDRMLAGGERERLINGAEKLSTEIEMTLLEKRVQNFQRGTATGALMLGMTHEFKNQLSPIQTKAFRLQRRVSNNQSLTAQDMAEDIGELAGYVRDFSSLLKTFLEMSKESHAEVGMKELILETLQFCESAAKQYHVSLVVTGLAQIPNRKCPFVLRQALMNLVINAVQHVHLTPGIQNRLVQVKIECAKGKPLQIHIIDNGYGVSAKLKERLFQMFVSHREDGFGLGLYLTKQIITNLGGTVEVRNRSRYANNTFTITLPNETIK